MTMMTETIARAMAGLAMTVALMVETMILAHQQPQQPQPLQLQRPLQQQQPQQPPVALRASLSVRKATCGLPFFWLIRRPNANATVGLVVEQVMEPKMKVGRETSKCVVRAVAVRRLISGHRLERL